MPKFKILIRNKKTGAVKLTNTLVFSENSSTGRNSNRVEVLKTFIILARDVDCRFSKCLGF